MPVESGRAYAYRQIATEVVLPNLIAPVSYLAFGPLGLIAGSAAKAGLDGANDYHEQSVEVEGATPSRRDRALGRGIALTKAAVPVVGLAVGGLPGFGVGIALNMAYDGAARYVRLHSNEDRRGKTITQMTKDGLKAVASGARRKLTKAA